MAEVVETLQNRNNRNTVSYCLQCFAVETPQHQLRRCSRCKFSRYCNRECQSLHFASHKRDCRDLSRYSQEIDAGNVDSLYARGTHKFVLAGRYTNTFEQAKYLYEQALDDYIEEYELKRDLGESEVVILANPAIVPLRSRIPFLLAALGHDDLAVRETERAMLRWSRGGTVNDINRYSDVMMLGMQREGRERVNFHSWPKCFLLPLVLVKLRIVAELKPKVESLEIFHQTSAGQVLEPVLPVIQQFFMFHPTTDFLANQTNQLGFLLQLVVQNSDESSFLDFLPSPDPQMDPDDMEYFERIFTEDDDDELDVCEYLFIRDSFRADPKVRTLLEKLLTNNTLFDDDYFKSLFRRGR